MKIIGQDWRGTWKTKNGKFVVIRMQHLNSNAPGKIPFYWAGHEIDINRVEKNLLSYDNNGNCLSIPGEGMNLMTRKRGEEAGWPS